MSSVRNHGASSNSNGLCLRQGGTYDRLPLDHHIADGGRPSFEYGDDAESSRLSLSDDDDGGRSGKLSVSPPPSDVQFIVIVTDGDEFDKKNPNDQHITTSQIDQNLYACSLSTEMGTDRLTTG